MFGIIALLFLLVPIIELYVIVQVAQGVGVLETLALLIVVSIVGAWLVKWQGLTAIARVQQSLARGEMPTKPLVDGALILFAGALMLTPGFVTDAAGLLLLLPPTRAVMRQPLVRWFSGRVRSGRTRIIGFGPGGPFGGGDPHLRSGPDDVIDVVEMRRNDDDGTGS
ncbi:MAG: FxsA family protein [Acidimicrobiales bacterium]|nr:FxsA family protein [Acidimicrobiales bacterium]